MGVTFVNVKVANPADPSRAVEHGKHTTGKSCLYIKRLADVDLPTLEKLIQRSVRHLATANA